MSSASSKVLRIAQQIELLKISSKKNDVEGTTKPSMGSMGKHEKGTPPEKAPLPGSGTKSKAHQAVELILQKAKNRRLASAHGHDHKENRAPCEALAECIHGRAKVPDFVTFWLEQTVFFVFCPSTHPKIHWFVMLKYIQPSSTLGTEVSKALEGAEPVAFPLNSQYVKSMKKANCKTGDEVSTSQVSEVNPVEGKRRGTWNYSEVKSNFMDALKKDGFSYRDRVAKWDESDEKKTYSDPFLSLSWKNVDLLTSPVKKTHGPNMACGVRGMDLYIVTWGEVSIGTWASRKSVIRVVHANILRLRACCKKGNHMCFAT